MTPKRPVTRLLKPTPITFTELDAVRRMQEQRAALARQMKLADAELEAAEAVLIARLESGARVEEGSTLVCAVHKEYKRNVAWRQEYEKLAGKPAAERIAASVTPTEYKSLVISGHA